MGLVRVEKDTMKDEPEAGKIYSLAGLGNSIANGNSWAESVIKCTQCGSDEDSMVAYTKYQVCGKCNRKNHKEATQ